MDIVVIVIIAGVDNLAIVINVVKFLILMTYMAVQMAMIIAQVASQKTSLSVLSALKFVALMMVLIVMSSMNDSVLIVMPIDSDDVQIVTLKLILIMINMRK